VTRTDTFTARGVVRPHAVAGALRDWLATLAELPFIALLAVLALGIVVLAALPMRQTIDIGWERGWHSDLPFAYGWNTAEQSDFAALSFRWTEEDSRLLLPGLGARPAALAIDQVAATDNPAIATGKLAVWGSGMALAEPIDRQRRLHMLLPPATLAAGELYLHAPTWIPAGDDRVLGAMIDGFRLETLGPGVALPPVQLLWPLLLLPIAWSTGRRWGLGRGTASAAGAVLVALLLAALAADRMRYALLGGPLLLGALWGLALAMAVGGAIRRWAPRLGVVPSPLLAGSVALAVFWLMLLRYGGRLYPESMLGDLGFHVNRMSDVIAGRVFIISRHRGIDFPYPSAVYVLLAPLRLLPISPYSLVEWSDAAFGALGVVPIAYLALRTLRSERIAILAVAMYAVLAPPLMALWYSFLAHLFTQEAVGLLMAVVAGGWALLAKRRGIALAAAAFALIFFGHFGLFINVSLVFGCLLPLLWLRYRHTPQRASVIGLFAAFVVAEALALVLFYSAYSDLIVAKLGEFMAGGMGAVQGGRTATGRARLLRQLVLDGFGQHYAFVGVPLAVLGGYRLWRERRGEPITYLFWGTLGIAALQATIPFLTASTITTRWLSFIAWTVAIGGALVFDRLWRRNVAGRWLSLATIAGIGAATLWMWLGALWYRIRPIEPF